MRIKVADVLKSPGQVSVSQAIPPKGDIEREHIPQKRDIELKEDPETDPHLPVPIPPTDVIPISTVEGFLVCSGLAGITGLIGRQTELADLQRQIEKRQPTLVFGDRSIGKTTLLEQVAHDNQDRNLLFIKQSKPLGTFFELIFQQLYDRNVIYTTTYSQAEAKDFPKLWVKLKRENTAVKTNLLEQILSVNRQFIFLIDDVDTIPITAERLLAVIVANCCLIGTARDRSKAMMSIYYRMKRFPLQRVSEEVIELICDRFFKAKDLPLQDEVHFVKHLKRAVNGNPGATADLLYSVEFEPLVKREHARVFAHQEGSAEINIGLVWVLLTVVIAAFRVYGSKTGNLELAVGGTLLLMMLLIFRGPLMKGITPTKKR